MNNPLLTIEDLPPFSVLTADQLEPALDRVNTPELRDAYKCVFT